MGEGLSPGGAEVGAGLPGRGGARAGAEVGAGLPSQGRYLRVVGVGIVVSPGSVQREHTGGPRFVYEAGPRAAPPGEGPGAFSDGDRAGRGLTSQTGFL